MPEEPQFDARSIVDAVYVEGTKLEAVLELIEQEIKKAVGQPTNEMYAAVFSLIAHDAAISWGPHNVHIE